MREHKMTDPKHDWDEWARELCDDLGIETHERCEVACPERMVAIKYIVQTLHRAFQAGQAKGYRRGLEDAEKCAHRHEPGEYGRDRTFGYLMACEDIIGAIRALAANDGTEKEGS